jgi:hypothetical protein
LVENNDHENCESRQGCNGMHHAGRYIPAGICFILEPLFATNITCLRHCLPILHASGITFPLVFDALSMLFKEMLMEIH